MGEPETPLEGPHADGSSHVLCNKWGTSESVFEWSGRAGWCTPGTRWGSSPAMMGSLGWRYARPVAASPTDKEG